MRTYIHPSEFRKALREHPDALKSKADNLVLLKGFTPAVKAVGAEDSRVLEFVISTASVDREQDTIAQDGWDLTHYTKNPVVLFGHNHWDLPVGRSIATYLDGADLKSTAEFTDRDTNAFGYMVYQMYVKRFLHAVSVGFKPQEYTFAEDRKWGINYLKQELLEYSAVPVPANPEALVQARSAGIDTRPLRGWAERSLDMLKVTDAKGEEEQERLNVLRTLSDPAFSPVLYVDLKSMSELPDEPPPDEDEIKEDDGVEEVVVTTTTYRCGTEGCTLTHETRDDASACRELMAGFVMMLEGTEEVVRGFIEQVVKQGRVLSAANEERIRTAVAGLTEVLAQLDATDEDGKEVTPDITKATEDEDDEAVVTLDDGDDEDSESDAVQLEDAAEEDPQGDQQLMIDPDVVRDAVRQIVTEQLNYLTGRVD